MSGERFEPLLASDMRMLYMLIGGHIYFQTVSAAVEFDLFTRLKKRGSMTQGEIAADLGIEQKPARILMLGLTTLGLVRKEKENYSNSELANAYLVSDVAESLLPVVRWQHHINYQPLFYFHESLLQNRNVGLQVFAGNEPTLYERLTHDQRLEKIFQDAMQAISVQANAMFAEHVNLSHVRHLVDVGGGNGTNIIALARKYPRLRATVFDSPSVCEIATQNIAAAGLSDRLDAVPGDCFQDRFPPGVDCILFAHFFTIWSEEENQKLLQKGFDSLDPGGSLMLFNMMQSNDESGPLSAALGSPYFLALATGKGMLYTWQEYTTWMQEIGFTVTTHQLPRDHGVIVGRKP